MRRLQQTSYIVECGIEELFSICDKRSDCDTTRQKKYSSKVAKPVASELGWLEPGSRVGKWKGEDWSRDPDTTQCTGRCGAVIVVIQSWVTVPRHLTRGLVMGVTQKAGIQESLLSIRSNKSNSKVIDRCNELISFCCDTYFWFVLRRNLTTVHFWWAPEVNVISISLILSAMWEAERRMVWCVNTRVWRGSVLRSPVNSPHPAVSVSVRHHHNAFRNKPTTR